MSKKTDAKLTAESKKIIAFDFDGTLTWRDSFIAFLQASSGSLQMASALTFQPSMLLNYLKTKDRGALKARLLHRLLGDISQRDLETLVRAFVTKAGHGLFRPDALRAWEGHDQPDCLRVIVTASPELLVGPFGRLIGADRVIGTRLKFSDGGGLLPMLDGVNCRGEEKMCRLRETFGADLDLDAAYGDTAGDAEMLAAARHGHYRVFTQKP
ncbi:HAD-IB family hydrolase [Asticcacaulis sp. 201]|uniref:HAD-IB family hydrolase n=1 Tax=Asticcacaulis sp. 201 TaxID=3028787 RepID=UPI002915F205|nr:HAD-IB family hydrolase [Asticcacaulis sp. 201]MDV6329427.1 HAD-IB family hydrolase [Asticcacaulis sp. 201]